MPFCCPLLFLSLDIRRGRNRLLPLLLLVPWVVKRLCSPPPPPVRGECRVNILTV